jgi:hypothetical protein
VHAIYNKLLVQKYSKDIMDMFVWNCECGKKRNKNIDCDQCQKTKPNFHVKCTMCNHVDLLDNMAVWNAYDTNAHVCVTCSMDENKYKKWKEIQCEYWE